ncbi:hypothetical protein TWF694_003738 [Orbilia ellipsospora]|uniref:Uncharacterized protein n=1 Tax=Orbilia ellipsospora TaxID=2528407 RepID=A0AAV9X037_9PEZI
MAPTLIWKSKATTINLTSKEPPAPEDFNRVSSSIKRLLENIKKSFGILKYDFKYEKHSKVSRFLRRIYGKDHYRGDHIHDNSYNKHIRNLLWYIEDVSAQILKEPDWKPQPWCIARDLIKLATAFKETEKTFKQLCLDIRSLQSKINSYDKLLRKELMLKGLTWRNGFESSYKNHASQLRYYRHVYTTYDKRLYPLQHDVESFRRCCFRVIEAFENTPKSAQPEVMVTRYPRTTEPCLANGSSTLPTSGGSTEPGSVGSLFGNGCKVVLQKDPELEKYVYHCYCFDGTERSSPGRPRSTHDINSVIATLGIL